MTINELFQRMSRTAKNGGLPGDAEVRIGSKRIESIGIEAPSVDNMGRGRLIIETSDPDTWVADCRILPHHPVPGSVSKITRFPRISKN